MLERNEWNVDVEHEKSSNPDDHETDRSGDDFWKCGSR